MGTVRNRLPALVFTMMALMAVTPNLGHASSSSSDGSAVQAQAQAQNQAQAIRDRLSPMLQAVLAESCGDECPGFRIEPRFKSGKGDALEDLGFTRSAGDPPAPELASIEATVLVQDSVAEASRASLKQVVTQRLANEAGVPVSVRLTALSSVVPAVAKRLEAEKAATHAPALAYVKDLAWPLSLVTIALLALAGAVLALRDRRAALRERLAAAERAAHRASAAGAEAAADGPRVRLESEARALLEARATDLEWLLRDRAAAGDRAALKRVLGLFSAPELSARLALGGDGLRALAALPEADGEGASRLSATEREAALSWLERALDQAHWRRLEEERDPFLALGRRPDAAVHGFFATLRTEPERAAFLAELGRRRWPAVLGRLGAEERIALGIALDRLQAEPGERAALRARLAERIAEQKESDDRRSALPARDLALLEDYSATLPEKEGRALWAAIRGVEENRAKLGASAEALLETMGSEELVELCLRLDLKHLQTLLAETKPAVRARVLGAVPARLRERLEASKRSATPSATEVFAARTDLLAAHRAISQGEAVTQ